MFTNYNHRCYCHSRPEPGTGTAQFVAPASVQAYVGQMITTFIPGYGNVTAYVLDFNPVTGMARLILMTPFGQQYTQIHHSDMIGIAPAIGGGFPGGGGMPGGGFPGGGMPGGGMPGGGFPGGGFPGGL